MGNKIGRALVVGAGISGIRSALDLAESGYGVTLIDRASHMGGILSQLDYQFPTNRCGMCKMLPMMDRDASSQYCLRKGLFHRNIDLLLSTELVSIEGEPGKFQVALKRKSNWVDPERCVGCGLCVDVCPVDVPDEFNQGLSLRKAIYLPVPHAIPNPYIIDIAACSRCGECEKVCPTGAIRLHEQDREKFRILVVDDELIVRDSLKEWLEEEGFSVDMAESGKEALEKLDRQPFHLMLTDIKMPGMDGVEVLQVAREKDPHLVVVMMTAYATVETAVAAMKTGAVDYLVKPFEPEKMIPMILGYYEDFEAAKGVQEEFGAIVLCGGTDYYDPATGKNTYGYGIYPNVITSLEFERMLSGSGPQQGRLYRPYDGRPAEKIGWIQCVGSRDLQAAADYCSNVCCMFAVKEALLAKQKSGAGIEAAIFYMDMRTFEKPFQRYREEAENKHGIRFIRGRIHSITQDRGGDLCIRYAEPDGAVKEMRQDLMVLATGQRPASGVESMAATAGVGMNPWGFIQTQDFSLNKTDREGVLVGGAYAGLRDISNSVIQASAAALSASRVIHAAGGGLAPAVSKAGETRETAREMPRILVMICTCSRSIEDHLDVRRLADRLKKDPAVCLVEFLGQVCTEGGWSELTEHVRDHHPNRVLIGACMPYVYARKMDELAKLTGLSPSLMDVVDIRTPVIPREAISPQDRESNILFQLEMGIARLKHADPEGAATVPVHQQALVVGGGIAGMSAALAIADHGFHVDLVEKSETLGGNLKWLKHTVDGLSLTPLLEQHAAAVEKHGLIDTHCRSRVVSSVGEVGMFMTTVETAEGELRTIQHGATILATGGTEAPAAAYGHGSHDTVVTQKELAEALEQKRIDPAALDSVVMIQCVGSREEPRNYCSRICCASSLKHALEFKKVNPHLNIYVLYRDMMAYGFLESHFTAARKSGVIFIQYDPSRKPDVRFDGPRVYVTTLDPILAKPVEIEADLLVLATGVIPELPVQTAEIFGATLDQDGFFQEADFKWRPVDAIKEGVFACGLAHSPRSVAESIATAEAASQRALRILHHQKLPSGRVAASVRHALCSLCERCIETCPYGARTLDTIHGKVTVNPVMCQGCGDCASVCPNSASVVHGFVENQVFNMIDSAIHHV